MTGSSFFPPGAWDSFKLLTAQDFDCVLEVWEPENVEDAAAGVTREVFRLTYQGRGHFAPLGDIGEELAVGSALVTPTDYRVRAPIGVYVSPQAKVYLAGSADSLVVGERHDFALWCNVVSRPRLRADAASVQFRASPGTPPAEGLVAHPRVPAAMYLAPTVLPETLESYAPPLPLRVSVRDQYGEPWVGAVAFALVGSAVMQNEVAGAGGSGRYGELFVNAAGEVQVIAYAGAGSSFRVLRSSVARTVVRDRFTTANETARWTALNGVGGAGALTRTQDQVAGTVRLTSTKDIPTLWLRGDSAGTTGTAFDVLEASGITHAIIRGDSANNYRHYGVSLKLGEAPRVELYTSLNAPGYGAALATLDAAGPLLANDRVHLEVRVDGALVVRLNGLVAGVFQLPAEEMVGRRYVGFTHGGVAPAAFTIRGFQHGDLRDVPPHAPAQQRVGQADFRDDFFFLDPLAAYDALGPSTAVLSIDGAPETDARRLRITGNQNLARHASRKGYSRTHVRAEVSATLFTFLGVAVRVADDLDLSSYLRAQVGTNGQILLYQRTAGNNQVVIGSVFVPTPVVPLAGSSDRARLWLEAFGNTARVWWNGTMVLERAVDLVSPGRTSVVHQSTLQDTVVAEFASTTLAEDGTLVLGG